MSTFVILKFLKNQIIKKKFIKTYENQIFLLTTQSKTRSKRIKRIIILSTFLLSQSTVTQGYYQKLLTIRRDWSLVVISVEYIRLYIRVMFQCKQNCFRFGVISIFFRFENSIPERNILIIRFSFYTPKKQHQKRVKPLMLYNHRSPWEISTAIENKIFDFFLFSVESELLKC